MQSIKEKQNTIFSTFKDDFGYKSTMAAPKVMKVVVSSGIGSTKDKNKIDVVQDRLAKITGQKVSARSAKKSIATFKTREGDTIGYKVTLRGARMYDFLDRLFNIALPRSRDFRGIKRSAVDEMGNLTIGIKEHTVFPETADEELRDIFGLAVTIVSSAKSKKEAEVFFEHLGVPFRRE